jgi:hypothetical protein
MQRGDADAGGQQQRRARVGNEGKALTGGDALIESPSCTCSCRKAEPPRESLRA